MRACVLACIWAHVLACMVPVACVPVFIRALSCVLAFIRAFVNACMRIYVHACMCAYMHVCMSACVHVCIACVNDYVFIPACDGGSK